MKNNRVVFHAWHNQALCVLTPEEFEARTAEVTWDKPNNELDLRLHYLGMAVNIPDKALAELEKALAELEKARVKREWAWAEWKKVQAEWEWAWAEWKKAQGEWEKAWAEWEKAQAEWEKAWAEWKKAQAESSAARAEWDTKWHKKLCHPNCAWTPENRDIFAKGTMLARLLE